MATKQGFRPAPGVCDVAAELICNHHKHLMDPEVAVLFLFADEPKKRMGQTALAWAQKVSGLTAYFGGILIRDAIDRRLTSIVDEEVERMLADQRIPSALLDSDEEGGEENEETEEEEEEAPRFPAITPPARMLMRLPVGCVYGGAEYRPGKDFFIVTSHYNSWHWALSRRQQNGLTDHELCHLGTEENEKTGELKLKLNPHVSEEFPEVILRHGAYLRDVDMILKAAAQGPQLTFEEISDRDADPPVLRLDRVEDGIQQFARGIAGDRLGGGTNCEHQRFPTEAELDAEEREDEEHEERTYTAREAIVAQTGNAPGVSGRISPCPACGKGVLGYSVARNGHIAAKCSTRSCVAWME